MRARREEGRAGQPDLDPARLLFLDETWAATNMTRRYGRSPKGEPSVCTVPHGHRTTTTFLAALRADGLTCPLVDGAMNGDPFVAHVRQQLVPALRAGDVVVLDDPPCHKRAEVREAIEGAKCRLFYPPPCSPDLNPIEPAFAKPKGPPRSAGERAVEGPWDFLGRALDAFSADECRHYFRHCGYPIPDARKKPKRH